MRRKVTVLEDDEDIREIIGYLLGDLFDVTLCGNVEHFREDLSAGIPDLILLDIMLPDGDGRDVLRELRRNTRTRFIPVLMMSAHVGQLPADCRSAGFIPKPFDSDELTDRVSIMLSR